MNSSISFDALAFLDLTGGEQASLLRNMTPAERIRLAVDVATYFRSVGGTHTTPYVLDMFYNLMELRYALPTHPAPNTDLSNPAGSSADIDSRVRRLSQTRGVSQQSEGQKAALPSV